MYFSQLVSLNVPNKLCMFLTVTDFYLLLPFSRFPQKGTWSIQPFIKASYKSLFRIFISNDLKYSEHSDQAKIICWQVITQQCCQYLQTELCRFKFFQKLVNIYSKLQNIVLIFSSLQVSIKYFYGSADTQKEISL